MTWSSLIAPPAPPAWSGASRVHRIRDDALLDPPKKRGRPRKTPAPTPAPVVAVEPPPKQRKPRAKEQGPRRWIPWTLVGPSSRLPRPERAAACWAVLEVTS